MVAPPRAPAGSGRLAMRCGEQAFTVGPGGYVPARRPATASSRERLMLQVHAATFLRFTGLDTAFQAAAQTGQPVIGPPMSEEEAAAIAAGAGA